VRVEVIRAENHPAPVLAAVATPSNQRMGSAGFLGVAAALCALLLAGFVYSRRRMLKALAQPKIPAAAEPLAITPPHLVAAGPAIEVPKAAPSVSAAPVAAPAIEATRAAPVAPAAPVAAASAARESVARISSDDTTQDLAIDTELLERSYLDAMAIDTLGIDTANQKSPAHETADDTETHDTAGLDTVALDASELDSAVDAADLHTAIIDARSIDETRKLEPAVINNANLDYNLLDLDATAEHIHAQHVQMPSGLNDHPVVAERRTNIVDVLKTAIERDPNRRDLRMKLIETYYSAASMNRRAFLEVVKKLSREREFLSAEDWKKVVMMGREIAADDILFADPKDDFANCA